MLPILWAETGAYLSAPLPVHKPRSVFSMDFVNIEFVLGVIVGIALVTFIWSVWKNKPNRAGISLVIALLVTAIALFVTA
jgi:hypothetical protein